MGDVWLDLGFIGHAVAGIGALVREPTVPAIAAAPVIATFFVEAIGSANAHLLFIAELVESARATTATAAVCSTILVLTFGNAIGAKSARCTGQSFRAYAAGAAAVVVATLLARAIGDANDAISPVVATIAWRTATTASTAVVIATAFVKAIGNATADALSRLARVPFRAQSTGD